MSHKTDEGLALAREVKDNKPVDEGVLSALTLAFKNGKCEEESIECYENAFASLPDNLDIARELFSCYVKCGEFKKMQQLAQKLFKSTNDSKYIFWNVSCMLHQLDTLPVSMLELAEKMIRKILENTSTSKGIVAPGAEELKLLVEILRKRAAHPTTPPSVKCSLLEQALVIVSDLSSRPTPSPIDDNAVFVGDPSNVKSHPTHIKLLCIDILKDLHHYQCLEEDSTETILNANNRVVTILREVLTELPDQWDALETLVTVSYDSYSRNTSTINSLGELRSDLLKMQSINASNRGPYLAELLLLRLWTQGFQHESNIPLLPTCWGESEGSGEEKIASEFSHLHLSTESVGRTMKQEMTRLLIQYILKFESRQCCFTDIKPYISTLDHENCYLLTNWVSSRAESIQSELLSVADNFTQNPNDDRIKDVPEQLCRLSKLLQIDYFLTVVTNIELPLEKQWTLVRSLLNLFCQTHAVAGGRGVGGLREVQPGDELLMLASTILRRLSISQKSLLNSDEEEVYFLNVNLSWGALLGIGREKSPHSFCFTVDNLEPLRELSCGKYALEEFNTLGVRYIQVSSDNFLI